MREWGVKEGQRPRWFSSGLVVSLNRIYIFLPLFVQIRLQVIGPFDHRLPFENKYPGWCWFNISLWWHRILHIRFGLPVWYIRHEKEKTNDKQLWGKLRKAGEAGK